MEIMLWDSMVKYSVIVKHVNQLHIKNVKIYSLVLMQLATRTLPATRISHFSTRNSNPQLALS
jgi:hypothetical protein